MSSNTFKDQMKNERGKLGVASIEAKMRENCRRWLAHVHRRPIDAMVRRIDV